jgi:hypothetical protein
MLQKAFVLVALFLGRRVFCHNDMATFFEISIKMSIIYAKILNLFQYMYKIFPIQKGNYINFWTQKQVSWKNSSSHKKIPFLQYS